MKKFIICSLVLGLFIAGGCGKKTESNSQSDELQGTITMSGAWALYPMVVKWAEEFQKINPQVKIDIAAGGAGKGMADCLAKAVDIGMVSREIYPEEIEKGAWWVSVTKDAVVPMINEENPVLEELLNKGVTRETFVNIWITGQVKIWGQIAGNENTDAVHVYTRSDACGAAQTWAQYLGKKQEDLGGVGIFGDPGLAEAVKKDNLGIGFNNINYAYDTKTKQQIEHLQVLPIDVDGNGVIDANENFYGDQEQIVAAIADGRYPSPPARALHLVCQGKPEKKVVIEFIKWILTDGQQYVSESGYINLNQEVIQQQLDKLKN
ncbi:MAG: PstS family phosphate ABC transporter substrate-binding protein [Phycisphaerae bacterium]